MLKKISEGFSKCFCGKNVAQKHAFILIMCLLSCAPFWLVSFSSKPEEATAGIAFFMPVSIVAMIILSLYTVNFIGNSIKFYRWKESVEDPARIKALQILPEVNGTIFKSFWSTVGFILAWCAINCLLSMLANFIPIIGPIVVSLVLSISWQYIFCDYCKTKRLSAKVFNFEALFSYFSKVFVDTFVLNLLFLIIAFVIIGGPILLTAKILVSEISDNLFLAGILMTAIIYLVTILTLIYYYAIAGIYHEKIELDREI